MTEHATPVGGRVWTRPFAFFFGLFVLGAGTILWRFAVGLGNASALNDGYPWGIWIAFDVVTGTALACGGYAMALLVYILNKNRYHPLIRPAILTSALGYSLGVLAVAVDVGKPWFMYRVPLRVHQWNLDSALLEVAMCIAAYTCVLWIEMMPPFLEKGALSSTPWLRNICKKLGKILDKAFIWIIALGILLPTMHQSSLGTMMLLTGHKLHVLWASPFLPLLFLISCIGMGYAVVVFESSLASTAFRRRPETKMLAALSGVIPVVLFLFAAIRWVDIAVRGHLGAALAFDLYSVMLWLETLLFVGPAVLLLSKSRRRSMAFLFRIAMLVMVAGTLFRFNTYLIAFNPGERWTYFPAVPEIVVTLGLFSLEIVAYLWIVKKFPILGGMRAATSER